MKTISNWVEINDESQGTYNKGNQSGFKTSMLRSSLCDYSDAYILVKGTITVANAAIATAAANNVDKKVIFWNCAPFTNCISRINNTQVDDAHGIYVVILMYNFKKYCDNYSKASGILSQYCGDEPALANTGDITDFNEGNADANSFEIKEEISGQAGDNGTKNVEIMVPLKYLEMP